MDSSLSYPSLFFSPSFASYFYPSYSLSFDIPFSFPLSCRLLSLPLYLSPCLSISPPVSLSLPLSLYFSPFFSLSLLLFCSFPCSYLTYLLVIFITFVLRRLAQTISLSLEREGEGLNEKDAATKYIQGQGWTGYPVTGLSGSAYFYRLSRYKIAPITRNLLLSGQI